MRKGTVSVAQRLFLKAIKAKGQSMTFLTNLFRNPKADRAETNLKALVLSNYFLKPMVQKVITYWAMRSTIKFL